MNNKLQTAKYLIADFFAAAISWTLFYIFRKEYVEPLKFGYDIPITFNERYYFGLILIPILWIILYYLTGYYRDIYRKSRLNDVVQSFLQSLIGVTVLFFLLLLDDVISNYKNYYLLYGVLFGLHFFITIFFRLIFTSITGNKIHKKKIGFNTLMIGSNNQAVDIYLELNQQPKSFGNKIIGFANVHLKDHYQLVDYTPHLGGLKDLDKIIEKYKIHEVIIALETSEHAD